MDQDHQEIAPAELVQQLARREQQLEQLRSAYMELQQRQQQDPGRLEGVLKNINHLPVYTGEGDVTINSFFSGVEYLISTLDDEGQKKEAVRAVYYRIIQGEAKNTVINIPEPDNWKLIKETLKLRYKPDTEPHEIYKQIANLRINTVRELVNTVQNIKYKTDELIVYYNGENGIDLTNIESLLVNTIKEITQGTLLDKIYELRQLKDILGIMTTRRFEDSCIRPEYRKSKFREDIIFKQNRVSDKNNNSNNRQTYYKNNQGYTSPNYVQNQPNFYNIHRPYHNQNREYRGSNSGQFRPNAQNFNNLQYQNRNIENFSNQLRRNHQQFNRDFQYNRSGQFRRNQGEPMEIDNIQMNRQINKANYNENNQVNNNIQKTAQLGNPRTKGSQYRLLTPRQERNGFFERNCEEINYDQLAGHSEPDLCNSNTAPSRQSQDQFFLERHQTIYPS